MKSTWYEGKLCEESLNGRGKGHPGMVYSIWSKEERGSREEERGITRWRGRRKGGREASE